MRLLNFWQKILVHHLEIHKQSLEIFFIIVYFFLLNNMNDNEYDFLK